MVSIFIGLRQAYCNCNVNRVRRAQFVSNSNRLFSLNGEQEVDFFTKYEIRWNVEFPCKFPQPGSGNLKFVLEITRRSR